MSKIKRKHFLLIKCLLFSLCSYPNYPSIVDIKEADIDIFTEKIHNRYYFIHRLKKPVEILASIKNLSFNFSEKDILPVFNAFSDIEIRECCKQVFLKNDKKCLMNCWRKFKSYQFLDSKFADEFVQLIYLLFSYVVNQSVALRSSIISNGASCEELLDKIDYFTGSFEYSHTTSSTTLFTKVINQEEYTKKVILRFYILNRLKIPIQSLSCSQLIKKPIESIATHKYSHSLILYYITQINNEKNITPFIDLYQRIFQFQFLDDLELIKQFIQLFFDVESVVIKSLTGKKIGTTDGKKIDELLTIIDQSSSQILKAIEDTREITFINICKQYLNYFFNWYNRE